MKISIDSMSKEQDKYLLSIEKGNEIWCTEDRLFNSLNKVMENRHLEKNKLMVCNKRKLYPDIIIDNNIIVEFQGIQHFTRTKKTFKDLERKKIFEYMGYAFIELPYFVQLTENVMDFLFDIQIDLSDGFPHGFIHPKAILPSDFCKLGRNRFRYFMDIFPIEVSKQCMSSIKRRSEIDKIPYLDYM